MIDARCVVLMSLFKHHSLWEQSCVPLKGALFLEVYNSYGAMEQGKRIIELSTGNHRSVPVVNGVTGVSSGILFWMTGIEICGILGNT